MGIREVFKENLKFWRSQAGLTQEELSEKIGYGGGYISEIESRHIFPKPETIDVIARELGIHASQLFEERGCPKNAVAFDSEKFAKELADGLYVRLNDSMCSYFKQNL